jgi:glycosyltransferase involved in cell wall biosynthesis
MLQGRIDLDISVLIATYNRAEILRQTLENMAHLNRNGLRVEFVIVDNNSSDHTKQVVESFSGKLPIRYLFECRPGKNCALNKALNKVPLGKLVVFTDDDVEPIRNWLKAIVAISGRWTGYSIFGGKIYAIWPNGEPPKWAQSDSVQTFGFAVHDCGDSDRLYKSGQYPFGANFWVRREIFTNGRLFDESIGPRPGNYITGSETSFLVQLIKEGYNIMYSPDAVVGHIVQLEHLRKRRFLRRAYARGISSTRLSIAEGKKVKLAALFLFIARCCGGLAKGVFGGHSGTPDLFKKQCYVVASLGMLVETLRQALKSSTAGD